MSKQQFDPSRAYQGWSTVQTWCVALTIDNVFRHLTRAQELVAQPGLPADTEARLRLFAVGLKAEVQATAPWAWDEGQNFDDDVDWSELREHYERKNAESKNVP